MASCINKKIGLGLIATIIFPALACGEPDKLATCISCHGNKGISSEVGSPNLAGQQKAYLITQLIRFRNLERKDPTGAMNEIARSLSDADMELLAEYYSSISGCGR